MSAAPVLIAQTSDLHVTAPGTLAYRRVDTAAALKQTIEALNRFAPRPDLVVISGDVADSGLPEEYAHAQSLLAGLQVPHALIPGNHDRRAPFAAVFSGDAPDGPLNAKRSTGPLDILLIDSIVPGAPHGALAPATRDWLARELASSATRPALLFLHHPPFDTGISYMDAIKLRDADALAELLRGHPRARLLAAGHVHRAAQSIFAGVSATICPAGPQACALDFAAGAPDVFMQEPPAFHLHAWFDGEGFGHVVTHLVPIGEFAGPYPFENVAQPAA
jgi:3',5'-cyclic-AMP phosphodiesterase